MAPYYLASSSSVQPLLQKKPKLGEKSDSKSESKGERKNDNVRSLEERWIRYFDLLRRSEDFDIEDFPPDDDDFEYDPWRGPFYSVVPVRGFRDLHHFYPAIILPLTEALDGYNKNHKENYVFKDIVTVNCAAARGARYFITFEAYPQERKKRKTLGTKKARLGCSMLYYMTSEVYFRERKKRKTSGVLRNQRKTSGANNGKTRAAAPVIFQAEVSFLLGTFEVFYCRKKPVY